MGTKKHMSVQEEPVETAGEVFGDGKALELIVGANAEHRLLGWDGSKATPLERYTFGGRSYVPLTLDPSIARALVLPTCEMAYGSTRRLFDEISALVSRVTRLPENVVTPLVFFVFATWVGDFLPLLPCLWITVPPMASTATLAQTITLLCRRALLVTEPVTASRLIPRGLTPTIVSEVPTITRKLLQFLQAASRRGALSVSTGKWVDFSCAKIVISRQALRDPETAGFPLEIVLPPSSDYVPRLDASEADRIASEFQAKLLRYRLVNYAKVTRPNFDVAAFSPPTQELAHAMGACIVGDDKLQRQILPHLEKDDREIQVNRTLLLESIVIEALLAACHDLKSPNLSMGELTKSVNTILAARGEAQEISPETVGWKLRRIGLRTKSIPGGCKGLELHNETRAAIHALAAGYGVRAFRQGSAGGKSLECAPLQNEKKKTA